MVRFRRGRGLWGREEGLGGLIGMGGREGGRWFGSCIDRDTSFHHIVTISFQQLSSGRKEHQNKNTYQFNQLQKPSTYVYQNCIKLLLHIFQHSQMNPFTLRLSYEVLPILYTSSFHIQTVAHSLNHRNWQVAYLRGCHLFTRLTSQSILSKHDTIINSF